MRAALRSAFSSSAVRVWGSVVLVILPIIVAAVRAATGDWVPIGDDAYFTVRSRDVLTANHPYVGAWSSGSFDRTSVNNLGPLQLDLLAPFTRWTPHGGTAIGAATINVAAVGGIAGLAYRIAGRAAVVQTMVVVGLLTWTMGSEMLITPRQHQAMILPYLCFLMAAWAVARGDRWAMVIGAVAGSLVVQTHLSYPILVALLALASVGLHVIGRRLGGENDASARPYVAAVATGFVLWAQTLFDQFFRDGNLGTALFSSGEGGQTGLRTGLGLVARVLVSPNTLLRPGFQRYDAELSPAGYLPIAVLVTALIAASTWVIVLVRRRDLKRVSAPLVALVAVIAGQLNATLLPATAFGYPVGNYRWLWSTGAFIVIATSVPILAEASTRFGERFESRLTGGAFAAVAVLAVLNLWPSVQYDQAGTYRTQISDVGDVVVQLAAVDLPDVVVVESTDVSFGSPFVYPVLIELQRQGVDFRFESEVQVSRFGVGRAAVRTEDALLRIVTGDRARELSDDSNVVAFVASGPVVVLLEESSP
jgi:hypothetical protein